MVKAGYKQSDVGVIPEDWDENCLGELGKAVIGLTYRPTDVRSHGALVLRSSNIEDGKLVFEDNVFVDPEVAKNSLVEEGDILICVRNGSRDLIGKSALIGKVSEKMAFGAFMTVYRSRCNDLIFFQFQSNLIKRQINEHLGATINQITNKSLGSFRVTLPRSRKEQEAIAGALSDADALIESLEQLLTKKRQIKQGAMQELLTGKRRLPGFKGEWVARKFGTLAQVRNNKINTYQAPLAEFCIELEQIGQGTSRLLGYSDARDRIAIKYTFQAGDTLFGRLRPYLRKFWSANRNGVCSTEIWPLIPKGAELDATFLAQIVKTEGFVDAANSSYGTHMPRSDWKALSEYEILLPVETNEQRAIAFALSDIDAEIVTLEEKLTKAKALKQGMMQELLTGRIRLV